MGHVLIETLPYNLSRDTENDREITQTRQSAFGPKFELAKFGQPIYSVTPTFSVKNT
jgi:hypothetical protein